MTNPDPRAPGAPPQERHWFGPGTGSGGRESKGRGHPVMFGRGRARDFADFPDGGGYPIGFPEAAYEWMGVTCPDLVLHLCSGSMRRGVRVDIRPEMEPDIVCDARNTPFADETFDWIMIDPPYSEEYARNLYGTEKHYPRPGQLMKEAARLLKPGGKVGLLHFQVPMTRKPLRLVEVRGITTGSGFNIRAFTICEKRPS
jgi:SAM-dependent methyltransferase